MKKTKKQHHTRLLLQFLHGSKKLFFLSMLASAVSALCDMLSPQIVRVAVDQALGGADPSTLPCWIQRVADHFGGFRALGDRLWIFALAIVAVALVNALSQYVFRVANTAASERMVKTVRDSLFGHIARLPFAWHMKHRTGDMIQRCTSDLETLRNFISEQMTGILRIVILLGFSIGFMFSMDTRLSLIALAPVPIIIAYSVYFHHKIGVAFLDCDENEGVLSTMAQENLAGVRVVRAFGRERAERDRFYKQNSYYTDLWMKLLGDSSPDAYSCFETFTTAAAERFNAENPVPDGVYCQSFAFKLKNVFGDLTMLIPYLVVRHFDGENDGLLSERAVRWAGFRGVYTSVSGRGISHPDEVDIRRMRFSRKTPANDHEIADITDFYIRLVSGLKEKGL